MLRGFIFETWPPLVVLRGFIFETWPPLVVLGAPKLALASLRWGAGPAYWAKWS